MEGSYTFGRDTYIYDYNEGIGKKISLYQPMAPEQRQERTVGIESIMKPLPVFDNPLYIASFVVLPSATTLSLIIVIPPQFLKFYLKLLFQQSLKYCL